MKPSIPSLALALALAFPLGGALHAGTDHDSTLPARPIIAQVPAYRPGTVIVKLKRGTLNQRGGTYFNVKALDAVLRTIGAHDRAPLFPMAPYDEVVPLGSDPDDKGFERVYVLSYAEPYDARWASAELNKTGLVEFAEPYYIFTVDYNPSDPRMAEQYAVDIIQARRAWDVTKGDSTIAVGIVDTGVDWPHEDLAGNLSVNKGESGLDGEGKDKRTNGVDDDGNGKVDDYYGWDLIGNPTMQQLMSSQFTQDNDPTPRPNTSQDYAGGHGTSVAGCASARTDNAKGVAGTGFRTKIIPVKCAADSVGTRYVYAGYDGIRYAADRGARVINCSWGGPMDVGSTSGLQSVIDYAYSKGALVVAASGNGATNNDRIPSFPANLRHVLSVGASDAKDSVADFAQYGVSVGVWAPGSAVLSTTMGNGYGYVYGTSFSSPITSGVAALVFSRHPEWTPDQVAMQLRVTGDRLKLRSGEIGPYYYRRVNAYRAVSINTSFAEGDRTPGIGVTSYTINGQTDDTIRSATDPVTVQLTLTNYLAPAGNIRIEGFANQALALVSPVTIDSIATMGSTTKEIEVRMNPALPVIYSEGNLQLILRVTSGSYEDYVAVQIPVNIPGWHQQLNPPALTTTVYTGTSISTVSPTVAWGAANVQGQGSAFSRTTDGTLWSEPRSISTQYRINCLTAFSAQSAWAGSGSDNQQANVFKTTNGGGSWQRVSVAAITPVVNAIHFFDATNGIMVGDPLNLTWGIGTTSDGGATWKAIVSPVTSAANETGLPNSFAAYGDTLWFGTTNSRIYRSTNRGASWSSARTPGPNAVGVAFANGRDGMAIFKPLAEGSDIVAVSRDGGQRWTAAQLPFTGALVQGITFVPNTTICYLGTQNGVYRTEDFGKTWRQMAMPQMDFSGILLDATADARGNITAYGTNAYSQLMVYRESTADTTTTASLPTEGAAASGVAVLHQNMPNPFSGTTSIAFDLRSPATVELTLHDALGARIMSLADGRMDAGSHSVTLDAGALAPGVYFYTLSTDGGQQLTRRLVVLH